MYGRHGARKSPLPGLRRRQPLSLALGRDRDRMARWEAEVAAGKGSDLAIILYTSGTTGRPKGCMLTHDNFQTELTVAVAELERLFEAEGASTLLFLPLAHVFARIIQVAVGL